MMGSIAYGVSNESSDIDIYGFCIPPKHIIFPNINGILIGFDNNYEQFEQWQEHHIKDISKNKEYDFSVYNIIKYFRLCANCNPNMIDSLFVPRRCILHITQLGEIVRENRKIFLNKQACHKFRGYAFAQMHKMKTKSPQLGSKRDQLVSTYSYDVKYAYHLVRLIDEAVQILTEGDLDLERSREILKAIRRGEWTQEQIEEYFATKEKHLEKLYEESKLPYSPNEAKIKQLLLNCLEQHYGNLSACIEIPAKEKQALLDIKKIIDGVVK